MIPSFTNFTVKYSVDVACTVTEWIRDSSDSVPFETKLKVVGTRKYPYQPGYPLQCQITRISGLIYVHDVIFEEQNGGRTNSVQKVVTSAVGGLRMTDRLSRMWGMSSCTGQHEAHGR
jgi:hypothetical protein